MINNRQNGRRRGRGGQQARNGQPGGPNNGNRLDNRARGNAAQLLEKYKTLARDAQMQGDRVNTEYYLQFADHYFRVLNENRARFEEQRGRREDYAGESEGGEQQQRYQSQDEFGDEGWGGDDDGERVEAEARPEQPPQRQPRPRREERSYQGEANGNGEPPRSEGRRERRNSDREQVAAGNGQAHAGNGYAADHAPAEEAPARIEIDLPPSISVSEAPVEEAGAEAAPRRRRTRRPRAEGAPAEA